MSSFIILVIVAMFLINKVWC